MRLLLFFRQQRHLRVEHGDGVADARLVGLFRQVACALRRGQRLDESKPGSGLGLSIVNDLAALYGGSLALTEAPGGGLRAELRLPAV